MKKFNFKKKREKYLKVLFENAPNVIFVHDIKGNIYDANPQSEILSGYSLDEIIGANFFKLKLIPVHQALLASTRMARMIISKKRSIFPYTLQKKDKTKIRIEISVQSIVLDGKQLFFSIVHELAGRKQNLLELNKEKGIIEQYFNIVSVIIITLNIDGIIMMANKEACRLLEYKESEIIGLNWFENFIQKKDFREVHNLFNSMVKNNEFKDFFENKIVTKSGQILTIAWHNAVLKNAHGKINGIITSGENITEKRKKEEKTLREKENLEIFQKASVNRELKMIELKKEIFDLKKKIKSQKK